MSYRFYLSMVFLCALSSDLLGLSIGYDGSSSPFAVTYDQTLQSSFEPILQVVNDAEATVVVLSWQLELEVRPLPGAQGQLLFHSVDAPPDSMFGQEPGPMSDLMSPSASLLAFDADIMEFDGETVSAHMARNIVQLTLVATPGARGTFQLVMPEFDPENPDSGSSWFEAEGFEPVAFDNSAPSDFPGFVLLGTIDIPQTSLPGDFDGDGVVGQLDYDRWRADFGEHVSTPGEEADGNGDSIIDASDYVIWRKSFPMGNGSCSTNVVETAVPEPESLPLAVIVLTGLMGCGRQWSHWPSHSRRRRRLYIRSFAAHPRHLNYRIGQ